MAERRRRPWTKEEEERVVGRLVAKVPVTAAKVRRAAELVERTERGVATHIGKMVIQAMSGPLRRRLLDSGGGKTEWPKTYLTKIYTFEGASPRIARRRWTAAEEERLEHMRDLGTEISEIARRLGRSVRGVKTHIGAMDAKQLTGRLVRGDIPARFRPLGLKFVCRCIMRIYTWL